MLQPATSLVRRNVVSVRAGATSVIALVASLTICSAGGAIALVGLLMAACALISLGLVLRQPHLGLSAGRRERARWRKCRAACALRRHQYDQLRELADQIAATDPFEAERCELEALLDTFVDLSVTHQRSASALRRADGFICTMTGPRSHGIALRRDRHRAQCQTRLDEVAEQIDATAELVLLISQRVAFASVEAYGDEEVSRRLRDLDEDDEARGQLVRSLA